MNSEVAAMQAFAEAAAKMAVQAEPRPVTARLTFRDHQDITVHLRDVLVSTGPLRRWADALQPVLADETASVRQAVRYLAAAADAAGCACSAAAEDTAAIKRADPYNPQGRRTQSRPFVTAARAAAVAAAGIGGDYYAFRVQHHLAYAAHLSRALRQVTLALGFEAALVRRLYITSQCPATRQYDSQLREAGQKVYAACQAAAPAASSLTAYAMSNA